jgi:hypothetical protein
MTVDNSTGNAEIVGDEIRTILGVLDQDRRVFRAKRQIDALHPTAPDNPDVVGLKVRVEALTTVASYKRDGGQLPLQPGAPALKSFLAEAETALRPFRPLSDTNELALGRALFILLNEGTAPAEDSLLATLQERDKAGHDAALTFASRLAASWFGADVPGITASTGDHHRSVLFATITERALSAPLERLDPVLAHIVGRELLDRPEDILKEAGADLVEHAYDSPGSASTQLYDDAVKAVLTRQRAQGRSDRVAERALLLRGRVESLRGRVQFMRRLELDLAAFVAVIGSSTDPTKIRRASARAIETADEVRSDLADLKTQAERIISDRQDETIPESEELIAELEKSILVLHTVLRQFDHVMQMARAMACIFEGRIEMACEILELDDSLEGPSEQAARLGILMLVQVDAGRFREMGNTVDRLAELQTDVGQVAEPQETDEAVATVDGRLAGLQWLRRFDEAEKLITNFPRLSEIDRLERRIAVAIERIADADDEASATRVARRMIEHMLDNLDAEEESESQLNGPITAPHIRRRTRRRWLRRAYYRLLMGELDDADTACRKSLDLSEDSKNPELAESQMRDAIDAVVAMRRGDLNSVEAIAARDNNRRVIPDPTQRLIASVAALESGHLLQARDKLSELCRDRPGDVPAMVAYSNVLLIHAATAAAPEASSASRVASSAPDSLDACSQALLAAAEALVVASSASKAANTPPDGVDARSRELLAAAEVLTALRKAVADRGKGFSAIPSRTTEHYIMASSASVELRFAVHEWTDRESSLAHIKAAAGFLDAAKSSGASNPDVTSLGAAISELRRTSNRRRPRAWQYAVAITLFVAVGVVWANKHGTIDGTAMSTLTLTLLATAILVVFFPWLRKMTIGGVELDPSAFGRPPEILLPQFDRELLVTTMRKQLLANLSSSLGSSVQNVKLASGYRTIGPGDPLGEASTDMEMKDQRKSMKMKDMRRSEEALGQDAVAEP